MATLTLTLSAGDIKKAVKSDTYITGQIDKAADAIKNSGLAYNESAGDDSHHEVKLYRTMKGAVSKFEANLVEYVDPSAGANVANTLSTTTGDNTFTITIPVGSRFCAAFATTLSALAQEYIINMMLYAWWQSIKPALAKDYFQFAQESLVMVTKTLSKTPPTTSVETYSDVTGKIVNVQDPSFDLAEEDKTKTFTTLNSTFIFGYTLGADNVDDIVVSSTNTAKATVSKNATTKKITITAIANGTAQIILTSTGHPNITTFIDVTVQTE